MGIGHLELKIEELLKQKGVSKNTVCKELDIPRSNFNRYCRNEFQRLDAQLLCKLLHYFECGVEDLIKYVHDVENIETMNLKNGEKIEMSMDKQSDTP